MCFSRRVPSLVSRLSGRRLAHYTAFLFIVNAVLVIVCCNVALLGRTTPGIIYWLAIMALACSNGIWHGWASYKSRSHSPGMVTGLLIVVSVLVGPVSSQTGSLGETHTRIRLPSRSRYR